MKYLQRWKTRVNKSKQNASMPGPQREMAANYHTCATGARLCDILGVTPDELNDVGSLGNMMYANDQGLHDLSVHFHRQIVACEFGSAAKTIRAIEKHDVTPELLNRLQNRLGT